MTGGRMWACAEIGLTEVKYRGGKAALLMGDVLIDTGTKKEMDDLDNAIYEAVKQKFETAVDAAVERIVERAVVKVNIWNRDHQDGRLDVNTLIGQIQAIKNE